MKGFKAPGYTAEVSMGGFFAYAHLRVKRDADGNSVGNVGISRLNYPDGAKGDRLLRADLRKRFDEIVKRDRASLAKVAL